VTTAATLVDRLSAASFGACANPYSDAHELPALDVAGGAAIRRSNLAAYLGERIDARVLLVGEAMGYQGGRFSGMAFTSERQLIGWGAPYRPSSTRPAGFTEPSATIVHGVLRDHGDERRVVLWNAVPGHPHRPATPLSNRAPSRAEVAAGLPFLEAVIALIRPRLVVAVGRVAERLLGARADATVRHPSQGGASAFRVGLRRLL
jgi:uracil-DNA glycosylase